VDDRLRWARRLAALAQSGLTYTENPFDRARFGAVQAIAAEVAASVGGDDATELRARFADEYGYATPKVDVRGVVVEGDRLLFVREQGEDTWTLPGGWADVGETPSQAVEKEVYEESGLSVRAVRVLAVLDRDFRARARWPAHAYKLYVLCSPLGGELRGDGLETAEARYFPLGALPPLSVKTPLEHLERALAAAADPALGASID
jgi:ADP-ribose pyrophosphatase YjhB (NUDIX family)